MTKELKVHVGEGFDATAARVATYGAAPSAARPSRSTICDARESDREGGEESSDEQGRFESLLNPAQMAI
jgi:hypothetical protein